LIYTSVVAVPKSMPMSKENMVIGNRPIRDIFVSELIETLAGAKVPFGRLPDRPPDTEDASLSSTADPI
jgi:hypothetical protein